MALDDASQAAADAATAAYTDMTDVYADGAIGTVFADVSTLIGTAF